MEMNPEHLELLVTRVKLHMRMRTKAR